MHPQRFSTALTALLACSVWCFALSGCGDDPVSSDDNSSTGVVESSPVLSLDGELILSVWDSEDDTSESGIYAMYTGVTSRFQLLGGPNLSSPSLTPGGSRLIYLFDGQIRVHDMAEDTSSIFMRYFRFSSVAWLNDDILVAEFNNRLWLAHWPLESSFTFWSNGWDPTVIDAGEVVHADNGTPGKTSIVNRRIDQLGPHTPRTRVAALSRVRFPSPHADDSTYLFALEDGSSFTLAMQRVGDETYTALTTSRSPRAVFIDSTRFLYTGPNGRFWTYDITTDKTAQY